MPSRPSNQRLTQSVDVPAFQNGMLSAASPYKVREGAAVLAENVDFFADTSLRPRKGYAEIYTDKPVKTFLAQRMGEYVRHVYVTDTNTAISPRGAIGEAGTDASLVRIPNGVLHISREGVKQVTLTDLRDAGFNAPRRLSVASEAGGKLPEGYHTYTHNYLLAGGVESPHSEEVSVLVPADGKVTVTIPTPPQDERIFKVRIYRKGSNDGVALLVAELDPNTPTWEDGGAAPSPVIPTQGIEMMTGGNMALIHNRRLFVLNDNQLTYSYPNDFGHRNAFWVEPVTLPTGEPVTAMCPLGQGIVFFGLETAVHLSNTPAEGGTFTAIPVADGCVSQTTWCLAEDGTLIYLGVGGVYAMSGARSQRISDPISDRFTGYTIGELRGATLIFDQQHRRLLVALPREVLVYSFVTQAWSTWTIPNCKLDYFEGRMYMWQGDKLYILGEHSTDAGKPITGRFISGYYSLGDDISHKLFRRIGFDMSAVHGDVVKLRVTSFNTLHSFSNRLTNHVGDPNVFDAAIWDRARWAGDIDRTFYTVLPDKIQGRFIQYEITFETEHPDELIIHGNVNIEFRVRYRYGRV